MTEIVIKGVVVVYSVLFRNYSFIFLFVSVLLTNSIMIFSVYRCYSDVTFDK